MEFVIDCTYLWDIGKQKSPRCEAAQCGVPFGPSYSVCLDEFHRKKITAIAPKMTSGLGEAILMSTHNLCFGSKIRKLGMPLQTQVFLYKSEV